MSAVAHEPDTEGVSDFPWSPIRYAWSRLIPAVVVGAVVAALPMVSSAMTGGEWVLRFSLIAGLANALCLVLIVVSTSLLGGISYPPWLRIGDAGLEFPDGRGESVFVPWSAISSARLRWRGPLTDLKVAVNDPAAVVRVPHSGGLIRLRRKDKTRFVVAVGVLRGGPGPVRSELSRRGWPRSTPDHGKQPHAPV